MTPAQVEALAGPPTDEAKESEGTDLEELLWSYEGLALTFVLDRNGEHRLDYLHVERAGTTLGGVEVIGLDRAGALALMEKEGLGAPTMLLPNDAGWGFGRSKYSRGGESALVFWTDGTRVTGVQVQDAKR